VIWQISERLHLRVMGILQGNRENLVIHAIFVPQAESATGRATMRHPGKVGSVVATRTSSGSPSPARVLGIKP
jgi:hypothetical protein